MIIYRMTDIPSTNPSPWLQDDKLGLNRLCLQSFVGAFKRVSPKIHFILDHCDKKEYSPMIDDLVSFDYDVEYTTLGINDTMNRAYDIASEQEGWVLFQECDYLYRPNTGELLIEAIKQLGLVSPYDHLNFYKDPNIHSETCDIKLVNGQHFRTTERNTMTWGCDASLVRENLPMLKEQGYLDDEVWKHLYFAGHQLHVPIPAIATHCVQDYLSPGVSWEKVWQNNLESL